MGLIKNTHDLRVLERQQQLRKQEVWNPPKPELDDGKNKRLSEFDKCELIKKEVIKLGY